MRITQNILFITFLTTWLSFTGCSQKQASLSPEFREQGFKHIEVRANTYTYNRQTEPSMAADSSGNLLVVWGSRRQELGTYGVFGQLLDPLGRRIGSEFHINTTVEGMQSDPAVAFDNNDNGWIVWDSNHHNGSQRAIMARQFHTNSAGRMVPKTAELVIRQDNSRCPSKPALAINQNNEILVTWQSDESGRQTAMACLVTESGTVKGQPFELGEKNGGRESHPSITALSSGDFAAVWARTNVNGVPEHVIARIVDRDRGPVNGEWIVNTSDGKMHIEPSIGADGNDRFAVTWMTREDTSYSVSYRIFDGTGKSLSQQQTAAEGSEWKSGATVAMHPDGDFAVFYNVDKPEQSKEDSIQKPSHRTIPAEIRARKFNATGRPLGESFRVNRFNKGRQALTVAASGNQGIWSRQDQLALAWAGNTGQDDHRGIGVSIIAPKTLSSPAPKQVAQVPAAQDLSVRKVYPLIPPYFDPDFVREPRDKPVKLRGADYGFLGIQATGWTPPDPDIAAGPDHLVVVTNGEIAFFEQDGTMTYSRAIAGGSGFWGSVGATSFVFDPITVYDTLSNRFIAAASEHADNGDMALLLAVSDDSNPNGTWHKYRFNVSSYGDFLDFPNLGVDNEAIYISADFFNTPSGNWIFIIPKAPVLDGDSVSISGLKTASGPVSLGNTKSYETGAPAQYFARTNTTSSLRLHAVTDPTGTPTLHTVNVSVPSFSYPPKAEQLGTTNLADTIDVRIKNGVYRNGSLWLVHTIGQNNTARVRWYEIKTNGWPGSGQNPTLKQSGTFNFGEGEHNWMADINADDAGNAIICFNRSSSSQYISVQRAIRRLNDPLGTFQDPVTLQVSTSPETGDRWGDYAGVDEEPDRPGTFWTVNEYRRSSWRTWVARITIDCNENGIADECDVDCSNPNCNIPGCGTSDDCNENNIPDECEEDCNENDIADECEIVMLVTDQPVDWTDCQSETITLNVSAPDADSFQWLKNGTELVNGGRVSGATSNTLNIFNAQIDDSAVYSCQIADGCLETISDPATVTVVGGISLDTTPPNTITACIGATASMQIGVSGAEPIEYAWFKDGIQLDNNTRISGVHTNNLRVSLLEVADEGDYVCRASNICDTVETDPITVAMEAVLAEQPHDTCAETGSAATFTANATAEGQDLYYYWHKDGAYLSDGGNISGSKSSVLTVSGVTSTDAGQYGVRILSMNCTLDSQLATLTVDDCPPCAHGNLGDMDGDGDHDLVDLQLFTVCFGADITVYEDCACANIDDTNDIVDLSDWQALETILAGPE